MMARLQQAVGVLLLLGSLAATAALSEPTSGWMLAAPLWLLGAHALLLGLGFLLLPLAQRRDPAPAPTPGELLRAWLRECAHAARVFLWEQPWRSHRHPDRSAGATQGRHGVVFLHGFICNRGLWNPWMAQLAREGRAFCAPNLEPVFGSIDDYVPLVEAAIRRIEAATGLPPVLVCHSMGGLAARAWMRRSDTGARVARVVTLGTPHLGTALARWGHALNARQMRRASPWLQRLAADEPAARPARFVCFHSNCDTIVMPTSTATLAGADNRFLPGLGHMTLAFDPSVRAAVAQLLSALDAGTP